MKNIQKEIANIQKTIKTFSRLLDQIEKKLTGKTIERKVPRKRKKEKEVFPKQDVTLVNPPVIETETVVSPE